MYHFKTGNFFKSKCQFVSLLQLSIHGNGTVDREGEGSKHGTTTERKRELFIVWCTGEAVARRGAGVEKCLRKGIRATSGWEKEEEMHFDKSEGLNDCMGRPRPSVE